MSAEAHPSATAVADNPRSKKAKDVSPSEAEQVLADASVTELEAAIAFRRAEALKTVPLDDLCAMLAQRAP